MLWILLGKFGSCLLYSNLSRNPGDSCHGAPTRLLLNMQLHAHWIARTCIRPDQVQQDCRVLFLTVLVDSKTDPLVVDVGSSGSVENPLVVEY